MPEEKGLSHPGSFVGDSLEEFKKLPTWGKVAAAGAVGVVIFLVIRARSAATAQSAAGTSLQSTPGSTSPFPMVGNVPLLPSGTNPIYDPSGALAGYQSPMPPQPVTPPVTPHAGSPAQGSLFLGPTGVNHYVSNGNQNLSQIASSLGLSSWNSIYAIPENQQQFGALNATAARVYVPKAGTNVVVPTGTKAPAGTGGGPGMASFMDNPLVYLGSVEPHLPSSVPQ